jgi:hypothetical protein
MKIVSQDIRSPGRKWEPGIPRLRSRRELHSVCLEWKCTGVTEIESLYELGPRAEPEDKRFMFLFTNAYNE